MALSLPENVSMVSGDQVIFSPTQQTLFTLLSFLGSAILHRVECRQTTFATHVPTLPIAQIKHSPLTHMARIELTFLFTLMFINCTVRPLGRGDRNASANTSISQYQTPRAIHCKTAEVQLSLAFWRNHRTICEDYSPEDEISCLSS